MRISSLLHKVARFVEVLEPAAAPAPARPAPTAPEAALPTMRAAEQARVGAVSFGARQAAIATAPRPTHSPLFGGHQFRDVGARTDGARASALDAPKSEAMPISTVTSDDRVLARLPGLPRAIALLEKLKREGATHCTLFLVNESARTPREGAERALRRLIGVANDSGDRTQMQQGGVFLGRADDAVELARREFASARGSTQATLTVEIDLTGTEPRLAMGTRDLAG